MPLMLGDLVMCEFRADHDVTKMCGRILSNNPHVTHVFEAGRRKEFATFQCAGKPLMLDVDHGSRRKR